MARTFQISKWAESVAQEAIEGRPMQPKLASLAEANDMEANEIRRVAELANRRAQNEIYKQASDKRFKFALADAAALIGERQKSATAGNTSASTISKLASAIEEAGGDPFAPLPSKSAQPLSLFTVPLNETVAAEAEESELRGMLLKLGQAHTELEAMKEAGRSAVLDIEGSGNMAHDRAVESALTLLRGGVTLVDLYAAMRAAVSGTAAGPDAMKQVDQLALILIDGIKDRGYPNARLGFRHLGDVNAVEELSSEDLLALCRRASGIPDHEGIGITMATQKTAQMMVTLVQRAFKAQGPDRHPYEDAAADLGLRKSMSVKYIPAHYLDDAHTNNMPGGKPIVLNGDTEFVIGIRDLVGAQQRLAKCHAAQEYVGLKMKQIEEAIRSLQDVKRGVEARKEAIAPLLAGAARALAPAAMSMATDALTKPKEQKGAGLMDTLSKPGVTNIVTGAAAAAPIAAQLMANRQDNKRMKHEKAMQPAGAAL